MLILLGTFFVMLVIGVPVGFAMFCSSVLFMITNDIDLVMSAQRMAAGVDSFPLLAVGFFVLAGNIMNQGGITRRIFAFADHFVGHLTGGLAHSNVLASIIFSGMSGSAIADTGGLGAIELEAMKEGGYDEDFSLAVTGASSIIGPIIPPSVPIVIFGVAAGASIGRLFAAGVVPGIMLGLGMMILNYFYCKKKNYRKRAKATLKEKILATGHAFFSLLTPMIIIGGIILGIFTPTEAAIVAVVYAIILSLLYKEINVSDIPGYLMETLNVITGVLFIVASATLFSWLLTITQVPQMLAASIMAVTTNKYLALLLINIFLLIIGLFMDITPAIVILTPVLMPVMASLGINPVHFGILLIVNLMIGLLTPPVGMILYVLSNVSKVPFERIAKAIVPYILICIVVLLVITYAPALVMFVPNILFG